MRGEGQSVAGKNPHCDGLGGGQKPWLTYFKNKQRHIKVNMINAGVRGPFAEYYHENEKQYLNGIGKSDRLIQKENNSH